MPAETPPADRTAEKPLTVIGESALQAGRGVGAKLVPVRGSEALAPDELKKLYESRAANVSAEYRKHVEAYFRAISESAPPAPTTAPAK